ncbi:NADPH-dependent FMN reductase [Risungbinella massiliensis]|uniref:NADPH-dependent FMN reductase n=1 Tax=Risungbinella massiliensis TaxID=1329796 RepID=UPI0005CC3D1E|nr:NADPH-dependent FMN reductase [Risungbinella massiliensis]
MQVLLMTGSARKDSNTGKLARIAEKYLKEQPSVTQVHHFDARLHKLPLLDGDSFTYTHPEVVRLRKIAQEVDAFVILSPEYHSGMSGVLKNALDFLSRDQFSLKPVAIAVAAGGGKGGVNALSNLRIVLRGVNALVVPSQMVVDPRDFLESGELIPTLQERFLLSLQELVDITSKLKG